MRYLTITPDCGIEYWRPDTVSDIKIDIKDLFDTYTINKVPLVTIENGIYNIRWINVFNNYVYYINKLDGAISLIKPSSDDTHYMEYNTYKALSLKFLQRDKIISSIDIDNFKHYVNISYVNNGIDIIAIMNEFKDDLDTLTNMVLFSEEQSIVEPTEENSLPIS